MRSFALAAEDESGAGDWRKRLAIDLGYPADGCDRSAEGPPASASANGRHPPWPTAAQALIDAGQCAGGVTRRAYCRSQVTFGASLCRNLGIPVCAIAHGGGCDMLLMHSDRMHALNPTANVLPMAAGCLAHRLFVVAPAADAPRSYVASPESGWKIRRYQPQGREAVVQAPVSSHGFKNRSGAQCRVTIVERE